MNTVEPSAERADRNDPLTGEIIGAAFAVARELGHGFLESVYRRSLAHELMFRNVPAQEEIEFKIHYRGAPVGPYVADLVVAEAVIVEVKAVEAITNAHLGQTLNYLKASGLGRGLVLNVGTPEPGIQRVIR